MCHFRCHVLFTRYFICFMLQIVYKIFDLIIISLDLHRYHRFDHIIYYNKFVGDFIVK